MTCAPYALFTACPLAQRQAVAYTFDVGKTKKKTFWITDDQSLKLGEYCASNIDPNTHKAMCKSEVIRNLLDTFFEQEAKKVAARRAKEARKAARITT